MNEMRSRTGVRRRVLIIAVTVLMAPLMLLGVAASPVLAAPKGIFAPFAQCPTGIPGVALCQYVEVTSGELVVGPLTIPVDKTVIFQGGAIHTGGQDPNEYFLLPAANGESVSATELSVPGGLRSIIDCRDIKGRHFFRALRRGVCRAFSRGKRSEVVGARIESVASTSNPAILNLGAVVFEEGTGLTFPARLHLKNPLLGEECYIGSETHPIELRFTDGTTSPPPPNAPIKGSAGTGVEEEENGFSFVTTTENTLVDNAFSMPPAEGCGGHWASFIDPLINQTLGLESPAGRNTAILTGTHRLAETAGVLASEKFPTKENPPPPPPPPPHHHHHWWPTH